MVNRVRMYRHWIGCRSPYTRDLEWEHADAVAG
ncbi:hypothetical protein IW245_000272 [Longispora fulva]|uniref:Uncharacterized protein n=1 Tax=Longispora fulva TaxID=619741 RepID=A0A8J7GE66_9ACTN|nr:hypothetical protein [Longispora fulva]